MNATSNIAPVMENQLPSRSLLVSIVESFILLSIDGLAVIGNLMVAIAFLRNRSLRTVTNTFIIALCTADIIMALFPMPLSVSVLITGNWVYGNLSCIIQGFSVHFLAFVSLQIMALTAVNRYFKILRPSQCRRLFTPRSTVYMIIGSCIFSCGILVSMLFPRVSRSFIFHPGKVICVWLHYGIAESIIYTVVSSLIFVVLPAVVIIVCYARVFRKLRRHNKQLIHIFNRRTLKISRPGSSQCSELNRAEIVITRTLFGTVLGFFVCWVPCFVIDIIDVVTDDWLNRRVYLAYTYLAYTSSAINPVIYGILNPSFRREFFDMIRCKCR